MRTMARAYGAYEQRHSGTWFMIAAPSTSQPMVPMSAQVSVGELKIELYLARPLCSAASICARELPRVSAAAYRYRPCPPSSCTLASKMALRLSVGARVIQLPSGSMPTISECACWLIWRSRVWRECSGIQSLASMNSPAAMRASNCSWRCSCRASPASPPPISSIKSIPLRYIGEPFVSGIDPSTRALVDDAPGLAHQRALDGVGSQHLHLATDAHQGFDALLHRIGQRLALAGRQVRRQARLQLAAHGHLVQMASARHQNLVVPRQPAAVQHDLFDLRGKQVHATDDQHVVRAADDLADAPHRARCRRQQPRQI